jgi:hypothetical protein
MYAEMSVHADEVTGIRPAAGGIILEFGRAEFSIAGDEQELTELLGKIADVLGDGYTVEARDPGQRSPAGVFMDAMRTGQDPDAVLAELGFVATPLGKVPNGD